MKTTDDQLVRTNTLIISVFLIFAIGEFIRFFPRDVFGDGINLWVYTDWLIDYSSGFVRRGLSGELIDLASVFANPRPIVGLLSWFILGALYFGYIRLCNRSLTALRPIFVMAILFLPSLLPFYLYDHGAFGRKEILGFLVLLGHLWLLENRVSQRGDCDGAVCFDGYIRRLLVITVLLLPLHVLVHESSVLLFVPVHAVITYFVLRLNPSFNRRRRLGCIALVYLPVFVAFLMVFAFGRPGFDVAHAITQKWELAGALEQGASDIARKDPMWALPASLTALPWTFAQATSLSLSLSPNRIMAWVLNFLGFGFATAYVCRNVTRSILCTQSGTFSKAGTTVMDLSRAMCHRYFLLPIGLSMPLYVLGWDMGRWFAVSCINYAMISMSREVILLEVCVVDRTNVEGSSTPKDPPQEDPCGIESSSLQYYSVMFSLLFLIFFIRVPHCCNDWLRMLAKPLRSLVKMLLDL